MDLPNFWPHIVLVSVQSRWQSSLPVFRAKPPKEWRVAKSRKPSALGLVAMRTPVTNSARTPAHSSLNL